MYSVNPPLPVDELAAGTYFVTGPPMSSKHDLVVDIVTGGIERGENVLFVSTNKGIDALERSFGDRLDDRPRNFSLIDSVSESSGGSRPDTDSTTFVSSPSDMTGIGMYASRQFERFDELGLSDRTRVAFDNVSTLLMYAEFTSVFRFMHVLTNRFQVIDAIGFLTLDTNSHEDHVVESLLELGDGRVELRIEDGGEQARVTGPGVGPTDWEPI